MYTIFRDFLVNNRTKKIKLNERGGRLCTVVYKSVWYSEPSRCTCALHHENAISLISLAGTQPGPHASLHNNKCSGSLSSFSHTETLSSQEYRTLYFAIVSPRLSFNKQSWQTKNVFFSPSQTKNVSFVLAFVWLTNRFSAQALNLE